MRRHTRADRCFHAAMLTIWLSGCAFGWLSRSSDVHGDARWSWAAPAHAVLKMPVVLLSSISGSAQAANSATAMPVAEAATATASSAPVVVAVQP